MSTNDTCDDYSQKSEGQDYAQFTDNGDTNTDISDISGDILSLCEDTTDCRGDSNLEDDESACCSYGKN